MKKTIPEKPTGQSSKDNGERQDFLHRNDIFSVSLTRRCFLMILCLLCTGTKKVKAMEVAPNQEIVPLGNTDPALLVWGTMGAEPSKPRPKVFNFVYFICDSDGFAEYKTMKDFDKGESSAENYLINEDLFYEEVYVLFVAELKINPEIAKEALAKVSWWDDKIHSYEKYKPLLPQYPLLTKLNGSAMGAFFRTEEVSSLAAECLKVQKFAVDPFALPCLARILLICKGAEAKSMGIWFVGP